MPPPTLILLPGLDGTGDLFQPLLGVIPPNLPTRALSYPLQQALSYADLFHLVEHQLNSEPQLVLLAESFSGPLALRYAAAHPERVRAVILCATFVRSPLPRWLRYFVRPLLFRFPPPKMAIKHLMIGRGASDSLVHAVRDAICKVSPHVLACRLKEVFNIDCSEELQKYGIPILYLAPAADALVSASCAQTILALNPAVIVRTVAGPHLLLQREPQRAWQEIYRFLNETVGTAIGTPVKPVAAK